MIFILFNEAIYRKGKVSKVIKLEDIIHQEGDFDDLITHLHCPHEGCTARLVYNRKSNGNNYLSKKINSPHILGCPYDRGTVPVKTTSFFQDENGRLSSEGINRRKNQAMSALDDFIDPPKVDHGKIKPKPKPRPVIVDENDVGEKTTEASQVRRLVYDPKGPIVENNPEEGKKTYEPYFYQRYLHQISVKDQGENLKVSAKIEKVNIDSKELRAKIEGSFEGVQVTFELTPVFFNSGRRGLAATQLLEYIEILKSYIEKSKKDLYITTLCQSHKIDLDDLVLYIYEPDFMGFQFIRGKKFKNLSGLISAITRKGI